MPLLADASGTVSRGGLPTIFLASLLAFFVCWIVIGIGGWVLIWRARSAERKRRIHRGMTFIASILVFLLFVCASVAGGFPPQVLALAAPAIVVVSWLNLRFTTFCDGCNRMISNQLWWRRVQFCPYCGARLSNPI